MIDNDIVYAVLWTINVLGLIGSAIGLAAVILS